MRKRPKRRLVAGAIAELVVVYITLELVLRLLWLGRLAVEASFLIEAGLVIVMQAAALTLVSTFAWRSQRPPAAAGSLREHHARPTGHAPRATDSLLRFFRNWLVLGLSLGIARALAAIGITRTVDLTAASLSGLLVIPAIQAAVLERASLRAIGEWRTIVRSRPVALILTIDVVMLLLGWWFYDDRAIGLSEAGMLQRQWIALKLFAAVALLIAFALGAGAARSGGRESRPWTLAAVLAVVGTAVSLPNVAGDLARGIARLTGFPALLALEAVLASGGIALVMATLAGRRSLVIEAPTRDALGAACAAASAAFVPLAMNLFLSARPVSPWAGLAVAAGSLAATSYLVAGWNAWLALRSPSPSAAAARQPHERPGPPHTSHQSPRRVSPLD